MKSTAPSLPVLSLTIFLGLLTCAGAYAGLAAYGRPENFDTRVENLTSRTAEIKRLSRVSLAARAYRPGALCPSASAEWLAAFTGDLRARAEGMGLTVVGVSAEPDPQTQADGADRVALQIEVAGPYGAVTNFLGVLAIQTPKVFADRVDLSDRAARTSLRFTGHIYCATAT